VVPCDNIISSSMYTKYNSEYLNRDETPLTILQGRLQYLTQTLSSSFEWSYFRPLVSKQRFWYIMPIILTQNTTDVYGPTADIITISVIRHFTVLHFKNVYTCGVRHITNVKNRVVGVNLVLPDVRYRHKDRYYRLSIRIDTIWAYDITIRFIVPFFRGNTHVIVRSYNTLSLRFSSV